MWNLIGIYNCLSSVWISICIDFIEIEICIDCIDFIKIDSKMSTLWCVCTYNRYNVCMKLKTKQNFLYKICNTKFDMNFFLLCKFRKNMFHKFCKNLEKVYSISVSNFFNIKFIYIDICIFERRKSVESYINRWGI